MAQSITITIQDDGKALLLLNAFCDRFGYSSTISNPDFNEQLPEDVITNPRTITNPETKKNFVKRYTIQWWREIAIHGKQKLNQQQVELDFGESNIIIN